LIRKLNKTEVDLLKDDPVRPHITYEQRTRDGCSINVLESDNKVKAVVCTCLCNNVPTTEKEMFETYYDPQGDVLVAYTVWSYSKGAGREIINELRSNAQLENIRQAVTLSPLTEMAERFHLRNGASLLGKYDTCHNFEYTV